MRTLALAGHKLGNVTVISTMMFCRVCCADRLFAKLRRWHGEDISIGECGRCGNTQSVRLAGSPSLPGNDAA